MKLLLRRTAWLVRFLFRKHLIMYLLSLYANQHIARLEDLLQASAVELNALEAECRMYRIRLGWEIPGRYAAQGHCVWHANNGKQNPFPGARWEHVMPTSIGRIKDWKGTPMNAIEETWKLSTPNEDGECFCSTCVIRRRKWRAEVEREVANYTAELINEQRNAIATVFQQVKEPLQ